MQPDSTYGASGFLIFFRVDSTRFCSASLATESGSQINDVYPRRPQAVGTLNGFGKSEGVQPPTGSEMVHLCSSSLGHICKTVPQHAVRKAGCFMSSSFIFVHRAHLNK